MKAKKNTWQRFAGIAMYLFAFGLCVIFFITLISTIITLFSPGVLVTTRGTAALVITIFISLAVMINCVMYLYNEDERLQIGVLRVYDDAYKIGCEAVTNALNTLILSCVILMASCINLNIFKGMYLTKEAFTGYLVVRNCMFIIAIDALIVFVFALVASITAKKTFKATEERVIEFGLLVVDAEYMANKSAERAKETPDEKEVLKKEVVDEVLALPDMKKFPTETGIIQVFVSTAFEKAFQSEKWIYLGGTN